MDAPLSLPPTFYLTACVSSAVRSDLEFNSHSIIDPKVFEEYREFVDKYGDLSGIPTRHFIGKPVVGEEMNSLSHLTLLPSNDANIAHQFQSKKAKR